MRDFGTTGLSRLLALAIRSGPPGLRVLPKSEKPSVLVIKPCSIGDVLQATPLLEALRKALPRSTIALAVGAWSKSAVANNPNIDEIIDCGEIGTPRKYALGSYLAFARRLRRRRFDVCFVLDRSPMMTLLPFLARIPHRIGLHSRGRGFSLTTKVPVPESRHEAELYLDVARAAGLAVAGAKLNFYPTTQDLAAARRIFEEWGLSRRPVLAIAPGGGLNPGGARMAKRWQPAGFAAIADRLHERLGSSALLVGQESDADAANAVLGLSRSECVNLVGQTSFGQLGAILQLSTAYLGNDSAPTHLAAAVGTPVAAVYTATDPRQFGPYSPSAFAISAGELQSTVESLLQGLLGLLGQGGNKPASPPAGSGDLGGAAGPKG